MRGTREVCGKIREGSRGGGPGPRVHRRILGRTVDGIGGMCLQECALALLPVVLARRFATLSDQRQRQLLRRLFLRVKELPNGMQRSEHGSRRERALAQRSSGQARKGGPRGLRTSRSLNDSRELGVRRIGRPSVDDIDISARRLRSSS